MNSRQDLQQTGSAGAQFERGLEILSGPDTGHRLDEAVALVEDAAACGFAPAMELIAVFEVMGVGREQNWERAFSCLQKSAEQGSPKARAQLQLLARLDPSRGEAWSDWRKSISVDALLRSGERIALSNSPRIRVIESFASSAECRWLIERAQPRLSRSKVIDVSGSQIVNSARSNRGTEFLVHDMDVVLEVIRARISAATRIPLQVFEPTQILHYAVGEEFRIHHDFLDPSNPAHRDQLRSGGQRIATFLIYLNDEFDGGETEFPKAGVRYRGRTGDAIFWANVDMEGKPDRLTEHAGLAPTSGEKWILSQWIRDRAALAS